MGDVTTNLLSISVSSPSSLYLRALSDWKAIKSLLLGCCQFSPRCNTTPGGPIGIASYFESNDCILIQIKDGAGASCQTSGFLPPRRRHRSVYGTLNLLESSRQVLGADLNRSESGRQVPVPRARPRTVPDTTLDRIRFPKNRYERAASGISPDTKDFFLQKRLSHKGYPPL